MKKIKTPTLDKKFDESKEDVLRHFDLNNVRKVSPRPKRVNVDFPAWMVQSLDKEAERLGVTRQSLIKLWLADKLQHH